MHKSAAVVVLLLLPLISGAAGFAKKSVFLSKNSILTGETAILYAPISNSGSKAFKGSVIFDDNGEKLGSVELSMKAGEARVASVSWKPEVAGAHTIVAKLTAESGEVVETQSATFEVGPQPETEKASNTANTDQSAAAVDSSEKIQGSIEKLSPAVASIAEPFFVTVDQWRQSVSDVLDGQLAQTKHKLPGNVLGIESSNENGVPTPSLTGSAWGILWTLWFYVLSLLNFILISAVIFYPLLAGLFLYAMWKIFQRVSGRSYRY